MIHGGYWSERAGMGEWPQRLAAEDGYTVIEPHYRLSTDAAWPAQRDDITTALAWARKNADDLSLDPDHIAAFGSSAGGHLAAHAALAADNHLTALVALSPPLSPYRAWKDGADPTGPWAEKRARLRRDARQLVGCTPTTDDQPCWQTWRDTVTYHHATGEDDPPMLLLHFEDDLCPAAHSEDLIQHELDAGMPDSHATLITNPGRGHGMSLMKLPEVATATRAFLAAHTTPHLLTPHHP